MGTNRQSQPGKMKLALLVNLVAPYRVPVYTRLAEDFDLAIFHGGMEANRSTWNSGPSPVPGAAIKRSWGFQIPLRVKGGRGARAVHDLRYIHITPGYLVDLVRFSPHAIITNEMGFRTLVALVYGTLWRKPVWVWWGGTLHTEQKIGKLRKLLRRIIGQRAKHWISYGQTSTEYLLSIGVSRRCILQIQNCVDESRYAVARPPALEIQPHPVLLHVGQFVGRKGIALFLKSAAQLQREGHVFSTILAGDGPEKEPLQKLVVELGLKHVSFLPPQAPSAMPAIYRSADCLVFPTLEDVWGLVVNEALWSDLPAVASIFAGCAPELLPAECLFDPTNQQQFMDVLRRVVTGRIPPADRGPLWTAAQVTAAIAENIKRGCECVT